MTALLIAEDNLSIAKQSAVNAADETKAAIRKKAFENGDIIEFSIYHSDVEFNNIMKTHVMSAWEAIFSRTKETFGLIWIPTLIALLMMSVSIAMIAHFAVGFIHGVGQNGVFHVLLGFVPIIGSALVFSVVAWGLYDAGGGNLISYCRRGYSLDFVPELVFAANTVIGVGRNSLYYAENSRVGGPKIRIIEYDAIGEIESVAYTVKNSGQSFGDIENEVAVLDRFGRVGLRIRNYVADENVDVVSELKRRRNDVQ
jgi:hypothetical protein